MSTKNNQRLLFLTAARILGVAFSFLIPMYLGRHLDVETYGTYKQVALIFWFSQVALNFGLDDSVYYYFRFEPKKLALFSSNALFFNFVVSAFVAIAMIVFRSEISVLLNSKNLNSYLPILGILIIFTVTSLQLEGLLLNIDRFKQRLLLDSGTEAIKSLVVLAAFLFFKSIYIALIGLLSIMIFRFIWTIQIILTYKIKESLKFRDAWPQMKKQIRFGLPLGVSRIFQHVLNLETFLVSAFYGLESFTYYAVGCFENPLINSFRASLNEILNIELVEAVRKNDSNLATVIWRQMNRKLFLIVLPFVIYLSIFSHEVIRFIFSDKYLSSAPYFSVFNIYILIASINPEPLFRACSKTHWALSIRVSGVLLGALLMYFLGRIWGPMSVLSIKILIVFGMNIVGIYVGSQLLRCRLQDLFDWSDLLKIGGLSFVTAWALKAITSFLSLHVFWILALSFSSFVMFVFVSSVIFRVLKPQEIRFVTGILQKMFMPFLARKSVG
jgi:O-antigen/teichoic acid export membrane protein